MPKRTDDAAIAKLRAICMALPETNEKISHGEPTWFAGKDKVFAMLDNHHHGSPHLAVWLPQSLEGSSRCWRPTPERFFRLPYVGPKGWVGVVLDTSPDWAEIALLVRESYRLVATAKLRKALDAAKGQAL
ncbi:MAG: MmcQ/YjbR family DNA-binding protein [Sandaracinaceae bacterium]|nr:MmcQ/YjbR family DNA-binding protein [Sandaracinaceae bacterium]